MPPSDGDGTAGMGKSPLHRHSPALAEAPVRQRRRMIVDGSVFELRPGGERCGMSGVIWWAPGLELAAERWSRQMVWLWWRTRTLQQKLLVIVVVLGVMFMVMSSVWGHMTAGDALGIVEGR
jgi:hypothetical protein